MLSVMISAYRISDVSAETHCERFHKPSPQKRAAGGSAGTRSTMHTSGVGGCGPERCDKGVTLRHARHPGWPRHDQGDDRPAQPAQHR